MGNWLEQAFKEGRPNCDRINMQEVILAGQNYAGRTNPAKILGFDMDPSRGGLARGGYSYEYIDSALKAVRNSITMNDVSLDGGSEVVLVVSDRLLDLDPGSTEVQKRGYVFGLGLVRLCLEIKGFDVMRRMHEISSIADVLARNL